MSQSERAANRPDPDVRQAFLTVLNQVEDQVQRFRQLDGVTGDELDLWNIAVIRNLMWLRDVGQVAATTHVLWCVRNKQLSRRKAGELLGVHQATIARWLKEIEEDPQTWLRIHGAARVDYLDPSFKPDTGELDNTDY